MGNKSPEKSPPVDKAFIMAIVDTQKALVDHRTGESFSLAVALVQSGKQIVDFPTQRTAEAGLAISPQAALPEARGAARTKAGEQLAPS